MIDKLNADGVFLLGCGKMGSAMLEGWLTAGLRADAVSVWDPMPSPRLRQRLSRNLRLQLRQLRHLSRRLNRNQPLSLNLSRHPSPLQLQPQRPNLQQSLRLQLRAAQSQPRWTDLKGLPTT